MPNRGVHWRFSEPKRERYLELLREGGRRHQSARDVGVQPSTVARFAREHPEFALAIDEAEMEANQIVEDALFQAATSGNVVACQVWLYNRDPDRWMDMRRIGVNAQVSGEIDHKVSVDLDHLDDEIVRGLREVVTEMQVNEQQPRALPAVDPEQTRTLAEAGRIIDAVEQVAVDR